MKAFRKKNKLKVPEPKLPDAAADAMAEADAAKEKAEDAKEMAEDAKEMAEEIKENAENASKGLAFKLWVAKTFSCCLGTPEMPKPSLL
jgi:hypothetical protein